MIGYSIRITLWACNELGPSESDDGVWSFSEVFGFQTLKVVKGTQSYLEIRARLQTSLVSNFLQKLHQKNFGFRRILMSKHDGQYTRRYDTVHTWQTFGMFGIFGQSWCPSDWPVNTLKRWAAWTSNSLDVKKPEHHEQCSLNTKSRYPKRFSHRVLSLNFCTLPNEKLDWKLCKVMIGGLSGPS